MQDLSSKPQHRGISLLSRVVRTASRSLIPTPTNPNVNIGRTGGTLVS